MKVVSESRETWATSVPILVFLDVSVLDLGPMYAVDRQTDVRRASSLSDPYPRGGVIIIVVTIALNKMTVVHENVCDVM